MFADWKMKVMFEISASGADPSDLVVQRITAIDAEQVEMARPRSCEIRNSTLCATAQCKCALDFNR
jgi:hypothetical protein